VRAPMCVQATYFVQPSGARRRVLVHLFNGLNTTAGHGLPAAEVPLREEGVPVHGSEVCFHRDAPKRFRCEPSGRAVEAAKDGDAVVVRVPPLEVHALLAGEY